jgi:hypothetical protein
MAHHAGAALDHVDRLDTTISDLLRLARHGSSTPTAPIDLAVLTRRHAGRWEHLARRAGRRSPVVTPAAVWASATAGAAGHALDALDHGAGAITLVTPTPPRFRIAYRTDGQADQEG